jgi:tetratricopeptide (TPR) repeat protein
MPRQKSTHVDSAAAVGQRIREARERRGLRQRDLSFPGCTPAYISRIEAGARIPSLQLLREFGKRLGVSADFLARGVDPEAERLALADARLAQSLGELDAARAAFEDLVESAELEVRKGALLGLGQIALLEGSVDRAVELLHQQQALTPEGDPVDPTAVEALAHAYSTQGDLAAVVVLLEQARARAESDPVVCFRLTVTLANALIDLGQLDRAEGIIADSMNELGPLPDPIALARCLWSQSRVQTARGNPEIAIRYAEEALATIKATEHDEYAARAHHLLAYIELERGNPARAKEILDEAMPLIERGGDRNLICLFRLEQARALAGLDRFEEAQAIASALVVEIDHLSPLDAARSLGVLADVFAATGETDRALELYEAAAEALASGDRIPMLLRLYTRWSDLLAQTGETARALEVARRALNAGQKSTVSG